MNRIKDRNTIERTAALWLLGILAIQMTSQLALLFEALAPLRILFRTASFGTSLVALVIVPVTAGTRHGHHPSHWFALTILAIVALALLNPTTNTATAGVAHWTLYAAIIAPVFWVPRLAVSPRVLRGMVILLFSFHSTSAAFGVLQVYFPGEFQPAIASSILNEKFAGQNLRVTLADSTSIFRPMGLTDTPGGAAAAGLFAFVFGLGMITLNRSAAGLWTGLAGLPVGLFCIYLSQVRSALVMAIFIAISYALILAAVRRYGAAIRVAFVVPLVAVGAFVWAVGMGGNSTVERFETLLDGNPDEIYYQNRGSYVDELLNEIAPDNPFGAGLGRWGMMYTYFGDPALTESYQIWVEIMWTGWVVDGGIPLAATYAAALAGAFFGTAKVAVRCRNKVVAGWATLLIAYDVAVLAQTFNSSPFIGQSGLEFWLLNSTIYAAGVTAGMDNPRRRA